MIEMFHQAFRRLQPLSIIAVASLSIMFSGRAFAHLLGNTFGLDTPMVYVEAGLEVDPSLGDHPFPADPAFLTVFLQIPPITIPPAWYFWDPNQVPDPPPASSPPPPPTFTDFGSGIGVRFRGASVHDYAPHVPPEIVPSTKWSYDITVPEPSAIGGWGPGGWWWAGETRIRGSVVHPLGQHTDNYMAVVGVLRGTVPGPSIAPRRVIIGGSLGVHIGTSSPPAPQPIFGGGELVPPSHLPGPDGDFPGGELISILDPNTSQLTMQMIVDAMEGDLISNVYVRQGHNGPILMDLRPLMQLEHLGQYDSELTLQQAVMPLSVVQTIAAGNAYVSVEFPTSIHPDGAIAGLLSLVGGAPDFNGNSIVDAADYVAWRKGLGTIYSQTDYGVWRAHFGQTAGSASALGGAVPEPASLLPNSIGMIALLLTFRRRR